MGKVIGIVGSRRRTMPRDREALYKAFDEVYEEGDRIVSGGCPRGADKWAETLAAERGLTITIHNAKWDRYNMEAGFVRNTKIAEDIDILLAVVAEDRRGGTEDTVRKAKGLGKKVILVLPVEPDREE